MIRTSMQAALRCRARFSLNPTAGFSAACPIHARAAVNCIARRSMSSVVPFKLADIGEGIAEVELMKWFVKEGDTIRAFDRVCEVQSDKATVEITSRFDGIVTKVYHGEGDIVKVGSTLVDIQESGVKDSSSASKLVTEKPEDSKLHIPVANSSHSPAAGGGGGGGGSITAFKLADIGEGIAEVELMKWFVKEGDAIRAFDRVCEVQSDKATVEITSRFDGIVTKVYHGEGDIVKVGSTLVDIQESGVKDSSSESKLITEKPEDSKLHIPTVASSSAPLSGGAGIAGVIPSSAIQTTPAVRKIARENAVDLAQVKGTGPKNRITKEDVLNYVRQGKPITNFAATNNAAAAAQNARAAVNHPVQPYPPVKLTPSGPSSAGSAPKGVATTAAAGSSGGRGGGGAPMSTTTATFDSLRSHLSKAELLALREQQKPAPRQPIRGVARMMMKSMTEAREVQHLVINEEITFDNMKRLRAKVNEMQIAKGGKKMSFMPFIIKATSMALMEFPILNASLSDCNGELLYHDTHNIGIAMDTPKGLIVPVLKHVEIKNVMEIADELAELQSAGAAGTLSEAQLTGTTFSLSNIGSVGGTYASPVVVPPQVAIGAFGRLQMVPRYVDPTDPTKPAPFSMIEAGNANVAPTTIMNVSWSADHRVIDGATMARFSNTWKNYLENPTLMLTQMR